MKLVELFQEKEALKARAKEIDELIEQIVKPDADSLRHTNNKTYGSISLTVEGIELEHSIPKQVKWSQTILTQLAKNITDSGDDLNKYMTTSYDIPEKKYNAFSDEIKAAFAQARTVEPGKASIKIKEKKQ